ncbi:MAG: glycoside hydrolase family 2, partial [Clostridia bacterium]|nr:glycoside hydrolase family 2 [Clostridia bacterium]
MKKIDFNADWTCKPLSWDGTAQPVTLPHDAMRTEERTTQSLGEGNIAWFRGGDYEYRKVFSIPDNAQGKHLELEFEGVYHNPEITINGSGVEAPPYGYTDFSIDLDGLIKPNAENEITVIAHNADQPNSRWYSGTGIYRPVWLWMGGEKRIAKDGIRVTTLSTSPIRISVELSLIG